MIFMMALSTLPWDNYSFNFVYTQWHICTTPFHIWRAFIICDFWNLPNILCTSAGGMYIKKGILTFKKMKFLKFCNLLIWQIEHKLTITALETSNEAVDTKVDVEWWCNILLCPHVLQPSENLLILPPINRYSLHYRIRESWIKGWLENTQKYWHY